MTTVQEPESSLRHGAIGMSDALAADFAVLDGDPLEVEPNELSSIRVRGTYVAGSSVFSA
jgi:predicted amidohydrolase YtcJ